MHDPNPTHGATRRAGHRPAIRAPCPSPDDSARRVRRAALAPRRPAPRRPRARGRRCPRRPHDVLFRRRGRGRVAHPECRRHLGAAVRRPADRLDRRPRPRALGPERDLCGDGEASIRSDITYGAGVYKSTDGGAHWQSLGLADTRHIGKVLVDPRNAAVVLVAALGHAYGPNSERGVFRSTDGGRTWTKVLFKDPDTGAIDLAADPADPQVVYAALYQARRTPWEQYPPDEGPGSGLYKSTDGGVTWTPLTGHGLPAGTVGRIGLAVGRGGRV